MARNVSKHSIYRAKIGAVLYRGRHPISIGYNKIKVHPKLSNIKDCKLSIHAEVSAMVSSGKDFIDGSVMVVYRETADGNPGLARPCEDCMRRLKSFGVKKVIYSISQEPFYIEEILK